MTTYDSKRWGQKEAKRQRRDGSSQVNDRLARAMNDLVNIEVVSGESSEIGRKSVKRYIFIGGFLAHGMGVKWSSRCTYICIISIGIIDS